MTSNATAATPGVEGGAVEHHHRTAVEAAAAIVVVEEDGKIAADVGIEDAEASAVVAATEEALWAT